MPPINISCQCCPRPVAFHLRLLSPVIWDQWEQHSHIGWMNIPYRRGRRSRGRIITRSKHGGTQAARAPYCSPRTGLTAARMLRGSMVVSGLGLTFDLWPIPWGWWWVARGPLVSHEGSRSRNNNNNNNVKKNLPWTQSMSVGNCFLWLWRMQEVVGSIPSKGLFCCSVCSLCAGCLVFPVVSRFLHTFQRRAQCVSPRSYSKTPDTNSQYPMNINYRIYGWKDGWKDGQFMFADPETPAALQNCHLCVKFLCSFHTPVIQQQSFCLRLQSDPLWVEVACSALWPRVQCQLVRALVALLTLWPSDGGVDWSLVLDD